jgi:UDP-N-acetylglucosamine 2-epimerase (non-hydrolysing)
MKSLALVAGARPNFVKIAPILRALEQDSGVKCLLIHTGQHYDENLSDVFFADLGIRRPDISLGVGSGTHGKQTAEVMVGMERVLMTAAQNGNPIDRLVVVGDVNSTMAAAVAAAKLNIPVAHVEAGLRSFDRTMPEEINRILTDALCDMLLVSEPAGVENLKREGHPDEHIFLVGNVMIDTLLAQVERAQARDTLQRLSLEPQAYGAITLHRPSNVDRPEVLGALIDVLVEVSSQLDLVFPIHPRTMARLEAFGLRAKIESAPRLRCIEPLGYLDFLCLTSQAKVIVTDSGGLQEESTALGVPCLTMRSNTERPITCTEGTSTLIGSSAELLKTHLRQVIAGSYKRGKRPELWDGRASQRIAREIANG